MTNLPRSIGADVAEKRRKGEDPYPLTVAIVEGRSVLYVPNDLPTEHASDEKIAEIIAVLCALATEAEVDIQITSRVVSARTWNSYAALYDAVKGAYYCLSRSEITPGSSIPAAYKTGWEYALWYAFVSASKIKPDSGDTFFTIKRQTKLSSAGKEAWSDKETGADLLRLSNTIRHFAGLHGKQKCGGIDKFLKKKGFFIEHFCGKKPVAGIYTESELETLCEEWSEKVAKISYRYDGIGSGSVASRAGQTPNGLQDVLSSFTLAKSDRSKKIEDTARSRVPDLLVETGSGRNKRKVIVKGGTLGEKLLSINGGNSVRTIGKVTWSPEYGLQKMQWIDACMGQARSLHLRTTPTWLEETYRRLGSAAADATLLEWYRGLEPAISAAAQIYLEAIQENTGNPTWSATFGVRK